MAAACSSNPCVHKTLVDERNAELLRVKARNYDMQCEIERLKKGEEARIHDMQREMDRVKKQLEEARAELKETQAVLGQAFVSGSVGNRKASVVEVDADEKPVPCHPAQVAQDTEKTLKRSRSPSIEIIEPPISFRNKPKNQKVIETLQPTAVDKDPTVVPKSDPAAVAPVASWVAEEEMRRLAKRQKLEADLEEPVVPVATLADRRALEQASTEAGASLTWKEKHEVVRAIAIPPPEVKIVPTENGVPPKGTVYVSMQVPAIQPPIVKSSPEGPGSASAPPKETAKVPIASSSTSRTIKTERRTKGSSTALTLPLSVAETYLVSSTPLAIDPPPHTLEIPRKFLRLTYGGSDQQFLQNIPGENNPSGPDRRRLMFPTLALNPLMPSAPGMHGLVFASRREILNSGIWTVFCKRSTATPAVWLYVGEYENTLAGKMKAEEFSQQTLLVQREWATQLMDCKLHDCYVSMRARIALRIAGKLPVTDKIGEAKATEEERRVNDEITAVKNHRGLPVSKDDIIEAFCRGEEGIDVVRMRCVAYDHVFAEDMRAKYPNYPALSEASKKKKSTKRTPLIGRGRAIRRKSDYVSSESDEDSSESDDDSAGSGDDFVGPSPAPTKARRATLQRARRAPPRHFVT